MARRVEDPGSTTLPVQLLGAVLVVAERLYRGSLLRTEARRLREAWASASG